MHTDRERKLKTILGSVSADICRVDELQDELLRSEDKYRTLLNEMEEGYYEMDAKGNLTFLNEAAARMFGISREEMMGMNYKIFTPHDRWSTMVADCSEVFRTGVPRRGRLGISKRKDGSLAYREESIFPIRNYKNEIVGLCGITHDVTERKNAEEALKKSEDAYRLLAEHISDTVWLMDMEMNITWLSPSSGKARGFSLEEIAALPLYRQVTPESLERSMKLFEENMRIEREGNSVPGATAYMELEFYCKDGSTRWLNCRFQFIRDEQGKATGILGEGTDITERKLAEEERAKAEKNYHLLAENTSDMVCIFDMDLNMTWVSTSCSRVGGFTVEEQNALPIEKQMPLDSLKRVTELLAGALQDEKEGRAGPLSHYDIELEIYHKDGSTYWTENRFQFVRDSRGKATGLLLQGRDITARKLAEAAREEAEKNYRLLAENTSDVVSIMDMDLNTTWMTASSTKASGFSCEERMRMPLEKQITEDSVKMLKEMYLIALQEEKEGKAAPDRYYEVQLEVYRKDGSTIWTEDRFQFLRDSQGKANGVLMQGRDITARKQAEDILKKTMEELKRSNEELQQFAYVASHDLQEPLRMISSYVQLLEKRYKDNLDEDACDFINYAVSGSRRMQNLINDLLSYSRVGTKGKPFTPVETNEIFDAAVNNLEVVIRETGAVVGHGPLSLVIADEGQMVQVFQNLIGNAVKFHGIGIDPQFFERIFVVFQRLHGSEYPGTGIGLSIARKIAQRHGGQMWLESEPGKGSTFYFTIPIRDEGGKD